MGQKWPATGALGAAGLDMAQALLEEVSINPTIEQPGHTQDWGTDSWRGKKETCALGPRRKEQ